MTDGDWFKDTVIQNDHGSKKKKEDIDIIWLPVPEAASFLTA